MWLIRGFLRVTETEFKLYLREPQAAGWTFAFPVFLLLLFMLIWGHTPNYVYFIVPGLVGITVASASLHGLGVVLVAYRQHGYIKKLRTTPMPPVIFLTGLVCSRLAVMLLSALILILIATTLFGLEATSIAALLGVVLLGGFMFSFLGLMIASLCNSVGAAGAVAHMTFFPMIFLSGAFIPISLYPSFLQRISTILPLTHFIRLLRSAVGGSHEDFTFSLMVVLGFLIASIFIATRRMRKMEMV